MRTMHDAILVGIGTALNDDPQLNARHLPPTAGEKPLPRPVVVDRHLRLPTTCKLLRNFQNKQGRRPWIICGGGNDAAWEDRKHALAKAGAHIIQVPPVETKGDRLSIASIFGALRRNGINTLMVEGGAKIIGSLLKESSMIDAIIVTVAPTFVGTDGVGYAYNPLQDNNSPFKYQRTDLVGNDVVLTFVAAP